MKLLLKLRVPGKLKEIFSPGGGPAPPRPPPSLPPSARRLIGTKISFGNFIPVPRTDSDSDSDSDARTAADCGKRYQYDVKTILWADVKLWMDVYPSKSAPIATKLCQNAFQTIPIILFVRKLFGCFFRIFSDVYSFRPLKAIYRRY